MNGDPEVEAKHDREHQPEPGPDPGAEAEPELGGEANEAEEAEDRPRVSGPAVALGVLVGLVLGVVALVGLLVLSPASFVSLVPDWFTSGGHSGSVTWTALFLVVAGLVYLVVRRGQGRTLAKAVLLVAVVILALRGLVALAEQRNEPKPDRGCVVFVGGSEGCDANHPPPAPRPGG
ncbi:hypothetical protein [Actinoplanes sp. L3-i22]|uniref:hypothetical protein n=1 Tax=Actinoplanes sp. L3-i22 TaxID=2836373 RepID=UPI001C789690|nr:hypothetical protein [Actinoplanes sp. L3-i22]BCY13801.1 hypothetical protein L3i22_088890 [Actinoplanes sp. L3-i22]